MISLVLAHSADGLSGDGVPGWLLYALVVAGVAIGTAALRSRGSALLGGEAVAPLSIDGSAESVWPIDRLRPRTRIALHAVALAALAVAMVVGWFGSDLVGLNPLPNLVLMVWWVVPLLSWLLGDWWRLIDPFDAVAAVIDRVRGRVLVEPTDEADDWWIPAALMGTFVWLVTCWLEGMEPRVVATWLTLVTLVMAIGAWFGGRAWVRRSSPLAVLGGTLAAASPLDWSEGRPRLRSPLVGLAGRAGGRRSTAVVVLVLGTAFWESVSGAQWWADLVGPSGSGGTAASLVWSTLGLAACVTLTGAAWAATGAAVEALAVRSGADFDESFSSDSIAALAPMAVVAVAAHQLSSMLIIGQDLLFFYAADPLAQGWDLFGTRHWRADEELLGLAGQAWARLALVAAALGVMLTGTWDRLAARVRRVVIDIGWVLGVWTSAVGILTLWLLLDA